MRYILLFMILLGCNIHFFSSDNLSKKKVRFVDFLYESQPIVESVDTSIPTQLVVHQSSQHKKSNLVEQLGQKLYEMHPCFKAYACGCYVDENQEQDLQLQRIFDCGCDQYNEPYNSKSPVYCTYNFGNKNLNGFKQICSNVNSLKEGLLSPGGIYWIAACGVIPFFYQGQGLLKANFVRQISLNCQNYQINTVSMVIPNPCSKEIK